MCLEIEIYNNIYFDTYPRLPLCSAVLVLIFFHEFASKDRPPSELTLPELSSDLDFKLISFECISKTEVGFQKPMAIFM